ncbi:ImmA/IrrE family metallo-endopeptidase [Lysinibacillus sp. NPDC096212]|uniref:ImmA/IrrE family metallo-endopeptidase n=1 Tax=Lysinibacillus sp. NPDC096212 TaxID=3364135 RepID=UPI00380F9F4B
MSYKTHTEDFIENLYTRLGIFSPYQLDFREIAYRLDIQLYYWKNPSQALFLKGKVYIFLNEDLNEQEMWQDFCHELCHALWHSGSQKKMPYSWIEYQEWKADNFMLHACVPTFMLNKLELPFNEEKAIHLICEQFKVEEDVAYKRLHHYSYNHFYNRDFREERSNFSGIC